MTATRPPTVDAAGVHQTVTDIAGEILARTVDPAVDVFDQGATSLAFLRVIAAIDEHYGIAVEIAELEEASIDALAALIGAQLGASADPATH